jgi:ABC-type transport system substrate-binding protein
LLGAGTAMAQKPGGVLRLPHFDSPASMSILEEATRAAVQPMMGVFNNLVLYDQHIAQSSLDTVVPDLATEWSWSEDGKELTFALHRGVKWHDGKASPAAAIEYTIMREPGPREGQGDIGGVMQPLPEGVWGMPPDVLSALPGYDPDVQKNRNEARQIMQKLGYGPDKRLALKVSTRNVTPFRDPAVVLIDQLKEVYIDGELEMVETARWFPKMYRKEYTIAANLTGGGVDDPDQQFYENYACGSPRNYTGYCNPELEKLFDRQSMEADADKRKQFVWEIERKLTEDGARPIIFYSRFAYCWQPRVKDWTMMVNSIINNWRMEDVWLDR